MKTQYIVKTDIGTYYYSDTEMRVRHREDGPAVEYKNGDKEWWVNGNLHRLDGPAIKWTNGTEFWYKDGIEHREDGPAVEYKNGDKIWYLNGMSFLSEKEFERQLEKMSSLDGTTIEIDGKKYKLTLE